MTRCQAGNQCYFAERADDAVFAYASACDAVLADPQRFADWPGTAPMLNNMATLLYGFLQHLAFTSVNR